MTILVDRNVLLDVMTEDPEWAGWSEETVARCAEESALAIDPLIFAEVSIRFERIEELHDVLPEETLLRLPLPWEASFLAGKAFVRDRRRRGARRSPSPTSTSAPTRRSPARPCSHAMPRVTESTSRVSRSSRPGWDGEAAIRGGILS